jgi:hypothetical protein
MRLYTNPQGVYVSASGMPTSFLGVDAAGQSTATGAAVAPQMQLVMSWLDELKWLVPTK